jgi:predicted PhzF superfamily epimerase YddE/YHI9
VGVQLFVARVFVDADNRHGNPLGVFVNGAAVPDEHRQRVAADLGFSETVFVDDLRTGELRIYTPTVELPLAGHPLVGTAWLLTSLGYELEALNPPAGRVPIRTDDAGRTWFTADAATAPKWDLHEMRSAADIEQLKGDPLGSGHTCAWAWTDRSSARVRVRVFGPAYGVPEDPATGSAAMVLTAHLQTNLTIVQGAGSLIETRVNNGPVVDVGGRCILDEERDYQL